MKKFIIFFTAGVFCTVQLTAAETQPIFEVNFDNGSVKADLAKGSPAPHIDTPKKIIRFIPGVGGKGKAAEISRKERFSYRADKNILGNKGTIAMWFAPQTWDFNNNHIFTLINLSGNQSVRIFKHSWGPYIIGQHQWKPDGDTKIYSRQVQKKVDAASWGKGKWHHVTLTWDQDSMHLYLDGKLATVVKDQRKTAPDYPVCTKKIFPKPVPVINPAGRIYVGDIFGSKNVPQTYATAYDDIKIFDRPLTAAEILAEYNKTK